MLHSTHAGPRTERGLPREWMTEKHGLGAVQAPPPSSAGAGGAGSDPPLWLCSCLLSVKATASHQHQET